MDLRRSANQASASVGRVWSQLDFEAARGIGVGEVPRPSVPREGVDEDDKDLVVHLNDPVEECEGGDTDAPRVQAVEQQVLADFLRRGRIASLAFAVLGCRLGASFPVGVALVAPGEVGRIAVAPRREEGLVAWQRQGEWPNVGMASPSVHAWVLSHPNAPAAAWSNSLFGAADLLQRGAP